MSYAANPRAPKPDPSNPPQESTGAVTSDSLAAESIKAGEGFSENDNAAISGVKGSNSTLNTTDTSNATALQPAADGATREKQEALGLGSDERGASGLKYPDAAGQPQFTGTVSEEGYAGGPSSEQQGTGYQTKTGGTFSGASGDSFTDGGSGLTGSSSAKDPNISSGSEAIDKGQSTAGSGTSQSTGQTSSSTSQSTGQTSSSSSGSKTGVAAVGAGGSIDSADDAPSYAATVSGANRSEGELKPKGKNLTEGDIPQTKTFTGNVGGDKDPGRLAETGFLKQNADDTVSAGAQKYGGSGADSSTGGAFAALSSERAPDTSQPDKQ